MVDFRDFENYTDSIKVWLKSDLENIEAWCDEVYSINKYRLIVRDTSLNISYCEELDAYFFKTLDNPVRYMYNLSTEIKMRVEHQRSVVGVDTKTGKAIYYPGHHDRDYPSISLDELRGKFMGTDPTPKVDPHVSQRKKLKNYGKY